ERFSNVLGIWIGLRDILALDVNSFKTPVQRRIKHIGDSESWFGIERYAPFAFKRGAHLRIRDMAVAAVFMRERADIVRALHVVLPAQGIDANAGAAEIAGYHCQVDHRQNRSAALAMLGDAKPIVNRRVRALRIKACGAANRLSRNA